MSKEKKKGGCLKKIGIAFVVLVAIGFIGTLGNTDGKKAPIEDASIESLTYLRDTAMEIQEYDVASGDYEAILSGINAAQNVIYHVDNPTDEQIEEAYHSLWSAINGATLIEDAEKTAENAALQARKDTAGTSAYSRAMTVYNLVNLEGYEQSVAEQGVDASGIDWNEEAFQYAMNYAKLHSKATVADVAKELGDVWFTSSEIQYALLNAGLAS